MHNFDLIPVYHWRGARPLIADLDPIQTGWLVCLSLSREGDLCLLPLAWEETTPEDDIMPVHNIPAPTINTQAFQSTAITQTLADLKSAGWTVNGRFTITFNGKDTIPNFQQHIQQYLWQTPMK